ncbi:MAG: Modulator of Rho-dependent transcription termination (ROF) [Phormidesmis priestleyi Ana]|uniref:Modulator of Rho-dependent transcription termination (ROF) n=1 Tax=Phormidesmis priestleyi Ana TaxID=1666911 RepID=A0A0P8DFL6_9CYAN|nr:MAG: Modulator of Rho-dependent transcription termination (ROF) [Phormidesmis priestleyi Ana]
MTNYTPVSCELYDKLEAIATLHRTSQITYRNEAGNPINVESQIVDVYAKDGADYCKLADDTIIRLDHLEAITAGGEKVL